MEGVFPKEHSPYSDGVLVIVFLLFLKILSLLYPQGNAKTEWPQQ